MKNVSKLVATLFLIGIMTTVQAQKSSQSGVSFVMDLKPVLQLEMTSPEQINFIFNNKNELANGIVKNAATILKVTSTVKWDLYAVGRTTRDNPNGNTFWEQEKSYGSTVNSVANLPLSLLEIKQSQINIATEGSLATYPDYSQDFTNPFRSSAGNSLYVAEDGSATPPNRSGKYIAGQSGLSSGDKKDYMPAGSFYSKVKKKDPNFYYKIDYRILPGYPAVFPNAYNSDATVAENIVANANANTVLAGGGAGNGNKSFAEPGEYRMYVQYVLLEDQ
jgi:hypothetical protein